MRLVRVNDIFTVSAQWSGTHASRIITSVNPFQIGYSVPLTGECYSELSHKELERYLIRGEWIGPWDARVMLPDGV